MYYSHFGLSQPPFRITPNTEFFYSGGNRGPILEALIYAIGHGEGIIKVTGEVGSGKTMLCSMLQTRLPANVESVYIVNPSVSPDEILHAIALELQLKPPPGAGHFEIMQLLHQHLLERHAQHKQVVMFVEESQSMPIATLEEIRLLSNLETAHSKLLQIVLFGQPELEDNLRQPHIRQLRERITHSFRLGPLKNDEIRDYLNFRLRAASYRGPDLFSPAIIGAIAKASDGLTRRINLIADKALLAAFSENTHTLKLKHVRAAVRDSEFSNYGPPQSRIRLGTAATIFVIGAGIGIALYAALKAYAPEPTSRTESAVPSQPAVSTPDGDTARQQATPASVAGNPQLAPTAPVGNTTPTEPSDSAKPKLANVVENDLIKDVKSPEKSIKTIDKYEVSERSHRQVFSSEMVEARLAATRTWLIQQSESTYSIQLLGADNPQQLKNHLNIIRKYVEINDIFVYAKQKPSLTVLYGTYSDRRTAQGALAALPASLKVYKPILRTVQGIRAEIAQNQPS